MGVGGFVIIPVCHGLWVACGECKYETCIFKIETPQKSAYEGVPQACRNHHAEK